MIINWFLVIIIDFSFTADSQPYSAHYTLQYLFLFSFVIDAAIWFYIAALFVLWMMSFSFKNSFMYSSWWLLIILKCIIRNSLRTMKDLTCEVFTTVGPEQLIKNISHVRERRLLIEWTSVLLSHTFQAILFMVLLTRFPLDIFDFNNGFKLTKTATLSSNCPAKAWEYTWGKYMVTCESTNAN